MVWGFWFFLVFLVVFVFFFVWVCYDVICLWCRFGCMCVVYIFCIGGCGWWCVCMYGFCKVWVWSIFLFCKECFYWLVCNYLFYIICFYFEEFFWIYLEYLLEIFIYCIKEFSIVYYNCFRLWFGVYIIFFYL